MLPSSLFRRLLQGESLRPTLPPGKLIRLDLWQRKCRVYLNGHGVSSVRPKEPQSILHSLLLGWIEAELRICTFLTSSSIQISYLKRGIIELCADRSGVTKCRWRNFLGEHWAHCKPNSFSSWQDSFQTLPYHPAFLSIPLKSDRYLVKRKLCIFETHLDHS